MDDANPQENPQKESSPPTFQEAAAYWIKLGFISFGGPAGQIAMMQTECVDKRNWLSQGAFLRGLNYAMILPGPEAQQLAAYIGWRLHGVLGAVFAGTMFVLPGAILMIALAWIAAAHGDNSLVSAIFHGIKPVVVAIVIGAVWRIGKKTCRGVAAVTLAAAAFAALQFAGIPFPLVVLAAGLAGIALARVAPGALQAGHGHGAPADNDTATGKHTGLARFWRITAVFAALWAIPCAAFVLILGPDPFLDVVKLFTTAAFVTFGGAYAVLPYVADAGVNTYGWLSGAEMINGLALAETTPGPLILVTVFVGFFAGFTGGGAMLGTLSAILTAYVTFLPSLYFIISGAPYVERIQRFAWARDVLSAITAAVVGVILSLAVFLGRAAFVTADGGVDWVSVAAALIAFVLLATNKLGIPALVGLGAVFGLALSFI